MHNRFQSTLPDMRTQSTKSMNNPLNSRKHSLQHERMAMNSFNRATDWAKDKLMEEETMKTLRGGTIPLAHPEFHGFRSRDKTKELHQKDVYLQHYQTADKRAETTRQDFRNAHLETTPYQPNKYFLGKIRNQEKEMGSTMRYGLRTQNDRLDAHLSGTNRLLDPASTENTMLFYPKWKEVEKHKWTNQNDFDLTTCFFRGRKSDDPWQTIPVSDGKPNEYFDGYETTGDLSRKRRKDNEISPKGFLTTVSPNRNSRGFTQPIVSDSIRMGKSANFFATAGNFYNKKSYPKTMMQVMSNTEFNADEHMSINQSPKSKIIQIKAGSTLDPLKESVLFNTNAKDRSAYSPSPQKSGVRTMYGTFKKTKNIVSKTRDEYIADTVRAYFD